MQLLIELGLVFILLVQPVWSLLDCAVTTQHAKAQKVVWILLLLFTWYLAGLFYGVFATRSRALRASTFLSVVLLGLGIGLLVSDGKLTPQRLFSRTRVTVQRLVR